MENELIYVIIVTYNGSQWIEKCLSSVYESTITAVPIVIDNGSTDNTLSIIKEKFKNCRVVQTGENLGFGKANNLGIKMAIDEGAEYIYLLNQDAWVETDTFEKLINIHKNHSDYGILSPIQLTGSGKLVDKNFLDFTATAQRCPGLLSDCLVNGLKDVYETTFVMAAHWLLYVPDLLKIGLFSPAFPHYGEDANLVHRYRYWKKKVGICPNTFAYHDRQYRKTTPDKQLYLEYIYVLTRFHDISTNLSYIRKKSVLHYVINIACLRDLRISDKIRNLRRTLKELKIAHKYRDYYMDKNCFNILLKEQKL